MWLHGSCLDITEGICGNANQDANDDLIDNNPNSHAEHYKVTYSLLSFNINEIL